MSGSGLPALDSERESKSARWEMRLPVFSAYSLCTGHSYDGVRKRAIADLAADRVLILALPSIGIVKMSRTTNRERQGASSGEKILHIT